MVLLGLMELLTQAAVVAVHTRMAILIPAVQVVLAAVVVLHLV
jgi:hypothetical protein